MRLVVAAAIALALATVLAPSAAFASPRTSSPGLYVPEASLMTMDGAVLWQRNANGPRRVASCIKMLNALVACDNAQLDDVITVSAKAAAVDGGDVGLRAGQKLTVRQLLTVMLVHSANGAAEALATGIAGSEQKYVAMMNAKAKSLGLTHTHAVDPHGLSPHGYSTANDLSVIARTLMADPELRSIVCQTRARLPWGTYPTTDRLLGVYPGIEGIKTGYTDPAGYCFVSAAKRNGVELLGVVLGADAPNDRFTQMRRLFDWGFKHATTRNIVSRDETMGVVEVSGGVQPAVTVHAEKPLTVTVPSGLGSVTTQVALAPSVRAPVQAGQTMGAVEVSSGGQVLRRVALVADCRVAAAPVPPVTASSSASVLRAAEPNLWLRIAMVVAGFGRMLGI